MQVTDLKNDLSIAKMFKNKLLSEGRTYTWLANNLQCSVAFVHGILNEKERLSEKYISKINKLLDTDY